MQWTSQLMLGVEEMDKEHKELVDAVERLYQEMLKGKGKKAVSETIDFLGNYVVTHFKHEEELQRKYGYPDFQAHKKIHADFIEGFNKLKTQINESEIDSKLAIEVNKTAVDWLRNHIGKEDRKVSEYILQKRLEA